MPAARVTRRLVLLGALLVLLAGGGLTWILVADKANPPSTSPGPPSAPPSAPASPGPPASAPPPAGECPPATVTVSTSAELQAALTRPPPGTVIRLADTVFTGNFTVTGAGTPEQPVRVCGSGNSILDGGKLDDGYVLHIDQASHWVFQGFAVRNGQKGVMVDQSSHVVLQGLTVSQIGDEAIHLRKFSTDNRVAGNAISDTGLRKTKFGEGVYIGTAQSNWCDISNCEPDRSDRNEVSGNTISGTTAECIDIKEGTSDGVVRDNRFDGAGIIGADSWVDVKGNGWTIENNAGKNSPMDGFQTHEVVDGWGTRNVFRGNTADVNGPGFGYALTPVRGNVVDCSNKASQAGKGLANEPCRAV